VRSDFGERRLALRLDTAQCIGGGEDGDVLKSLRVVRSDTHRFLCVNLIVEGTRTLFLCETGNYQGTRTSIYFRGNWNWNSGTPIESTEPIGGCPVSPLNVANHEN
jgi:hypothetical protein